MTTTRAGFVALAGRPNVGKSTLVNAIVGHKVAIVSDKPQTTRRAIRGVATHGDVQLVLTDLPGVQKPLDNLTGRMQRRVESELAETDIALFVLNASQGVGPGDRFIATILRAAPCPVVTVVNKVDRVTHVQTIEILQAAADMELGGDIFPVSARKGTGVEALVSHLQAALPESPFLFDAEDHTDIPLGTQLAELIREQVLRRTFQEVPHSVEVLIEDIERSAGVTVIRARAWVESDSQKAILVGSGGKMVKAVGTAARRELERELGTRVHLDLTVRVRKGWRGDDNLLDRLGIE